MIRIILTKSNAVPGVSLWIYIPLREGNACPIQPRCQHTTSPG